MGRAPRVGDVTDPAQLSLGLFGAINVLRLLAYGPQIRALMTDRTGASAVSAVTWGVFAASHLSTVLYALLALDDLVVALVFSANTVGCSIIVVLTLRARRAAHRSDLSLPRFEKGYSHA